MEHKKIASTILVGYHRTNMAGRNADNAVLYTNFNNEGGDDMTEHFNDEGLMEDEDMLESEEEDDFEADDLEEDTIDETYDLPYAIRKLTPLECWRLMGFKDEEFKKAEEVCSNSSLYKQAGNSIVVDVLEQIFGSLFNVLDASN